MTMLIKLKDGGITQILSDTESWGGCETCDYGSSYVNEYYIHMTKGRFEITAKNMYEYALTEGMMMEVILPNVDEIKDMTEAEFCKWIEEKVRSYKGEYGEVPDSLNFEYIESTAPPSDSGGRTIT